MSIREGKKIRNRLSREILGVIGAVVLIALISYGFFRVAGEIVVLTYIEHENLVLTDYEAADVALGLECISILSAVILFVMLFLFLVGERIAYISEIVKGIDALGHHEWDYRIPLEGNNELTELAERVNELSGKEYELREKEKQIQKEREDLIRGLSHDIRTPLTSILSYSEYIVTKDNLSQKEMEIYASLMVQKANQMKELTDRLLEENRRTPEKIEDGKLLLEQLTEEWISELEDYFDCEVDFSQCSAFSGEFDVQELRRIFDNLASNVKKYADPKAIVVLRVFPKDGKICICQSNRRKQDIIGVESTKIGIESIRKIAQNHGGSVEVQLSEEDFLIEIRLGTVMMDEK